MEKQRRDRRKLFHGGDIISALMSPSENKTPCCHVDEDADAEVVSLIFNGAAMEKTIPPFPFTIVGEEEKEIKLQYQKNGMERH